MRKIFNLRSMLLFSLALLLTDCSRVPVTGRRQLDILPDAQVLSLANDQYQSFLSENQVITGTEASEMVNEVGFELAKAVEQYFASLGQKDRLEGYNWEFRLVEDQNINAFAMPGGKVVVYTGLLKVADNKAELAVVMGHEIAHAIAKHGNERMSQALTQQLGGVALSVALRNQPQVTQQLFMASYGLGTEVGILLPYSRLQESEADKLGLIFMAMAGYNPEKAIGFWQEMARASEGQQTPEFLATHPSPESRIKEIQKYLPEAMKYYNPNVSRN